MERIKYFLIIFGMLFLCAGVTNAEPVSLSTLVTPQNVSFEQCYKAFDIPQEKLYYLSLAAINANRFDINEMQSKTGYIVFTAVNREFLASIIKLDKNRSMLKITPTNNVYYFPPGIVYNFFRYIDLNLAAPIEKISTVK